MWAALTLVAAIVFGPNGMTAADAVSALDASRPLRLVLWGLWLAGAAPAVRAALVRPELFYLRALPIGPAVWWISLAAIGVAVQAPWAALHWRGGGGAVGLAAGLCAAGASAALAVRPRRPVELAAMAAAAGGVAMVIILGAPAWAGIAVGALAMGVAVPIAWRRAPESAVARRGTRTWIAGPVPIALAIYHAVALWRRDRGALHRGVVLVAAGGAAAGMMGVGVLGSTAIAALTLTAAIFGLAAPVARARREAGWLLDSSGVTANVRAVAAAVVLLVVGVMAGAVHAGLAQAFGPGDVERGLAAIAFAVALAAAAVPAARWADWPGGVDGTRVVIAAIGVAMTVLIILSGVAATASP